MPKHDYDFVCLEWPSLSMWIDLGVLMYRPYTEGR